MGKASGEVGCLNGFHAGEGAARQLVASCSLQAVKLENWVKVSEPPAGRVTDSKLLSSTEAETKQQRARCYYSLIPLSSALALPLMKKISKTPASYPAWSLTIESSSSWKYLRRWTDQMIDLPERNNIDIFDSIQFDLIIIIFGALMFTQPAKPSLRVHFIWTTTNGTNGNGICDAARCVVLVLNMSCTLTTWLLHLHARWSGDNHCQKVGNDEWMNL